MKIAFSIFLSFLILFCSVSNGVIYLAFKIKQSEIIEKLCVNRVFPDKNCHGKCFLKDKFEESNDDNNPAAPWTSVDENIKINFSSFDLNLKSIPAKVVAPKSNFAHSPFSFQHYYSSLLRPPISA
ncbi:MAG: hypothetical protein AAFZ15_31655 [Bacteroidota bacterium]